MIMLSTSVCRTRLTEVLCRANPSVEARLATKLSSQTRASDLRQAQQMRDVRRLVVIIIYSTQSYEITNSASFFINWSISASRATFAISI